MQWTNLQSIFQIPAVRQLLALLATAGAVAAGLAIFFWSQSPGYRPLYTQLDERETARIVGELESQGVEYRLDPRTGSVLVPADRIYDLRLELAAKGIPDRRGTGFELIREDPGLGVSQFLETARYQHALETELARTIASMDTVRSARVHLAMPQRTAFTRDRRDASASVLVDLASGRGLETQQVDAIVHLVASSVPGLSPDRVSVVDQAGRLLSGSDEDDIGLSARQLEYRRRVEQAYVRRIEELLLPLTGPGRVSAQVTIDMDFSVREEAREQYDPERLAVRSEQVSEEALDGGRRVAGIPGAVSNGPRPREPRLREGEDANGIAYSATRNYEVDRSVSHVRQPGGRIRRVTAAVLVDHVPAPGEDGTLQYVPLDEEQLERVRALVQEAVGFDPQRGDSVSVMNARFAPLPEPEERPVPLWENPAVLQLGRVLLGSITVLVIALLVLRPALRSLVQGPQPAVVALDAAGALAAPGESQPAAIADLRQAEDDDEERPDETRPGEAADERAPGRNVPQFEEKLAAAQKAVQEDPRRVAQVVRSWVGDDG